MKRIKITNYQLPITPYLFLLLSSLLLAACTAPPTPAASVPTEIPPSKTPLILPPTWTPLPPTDTPLPPTPRPTHTNTAEPTLAPTFPPTATAFPPINVASADSRPPLPFALLFLQRGVVREWKTDGTLGDLVTLPGTTDRLEQVDLFDVSAGGTLVAMVRRMTIGESEIILYDRAAQAIRWTRTLPLDNITAVDISFDNFWVAFASSGTLTEPGSVGAILTETPEQTLFLGECQPSCASLRWRVSNANIVWSDETGVWQADPLEGVTQVIEQLAPPPIQALNADGTTETGVYSLLSFSPSGRYMLLSKGSVPETIPTVYDTETGKFADIPGSFLYTDPGTSAAWMIEDRLIVARSGLGGDGRPGLEVWVMAPETDALIVQERTAIVGTAASQAPFMLTRLADGRVRFGLLDFSTPHYSLGNGVYEADPRIDSLTQLNNLPFLRANESIWASDGSGVLFITAGKFYFVPGNGGTIFDVGGFIGLGACCFAWAP